MNHGSERKPSILIDPVNFYQTYGNILQQQSNQVPNPSANLGTNFNSNQPILEGLVSKINTNNVFSEVPLSISPVPAPLSVSSMRQVSTPSQSNTSLDVILSGQKQNTIAQNRDDFLLGTSNSNSTKLNGMISEQNFQPVDLDALALDFPNMSQELWSALFEEAVPQNANFHLSKKSTTDSSVTVPQSLPTISPSSSPSLNNNITNVSETEVYKQLQLENHQQVQELQQALKRQGDLLSQMGQLKQQNEILMQSLLETYQSMQQQLQQVKNQFNYIERPLGILPQDRQFIVPHFQASPLLTNQQLQTNMIWNKANIHTLMQSNQTMTQHHLQAFANQATSIWDRHTLELIGFNTAFLQLVGRTEQELMTTGFCIHHLAPPHTRFVFETIQRCLVKARIYHFEGSQTIYRPQYNDTIYLTCSYYFDTNVFTCTHRRIPKNDDHFVIENKVFEKDFELDEKNPQVFQNFLYYKMNKYVSELQKYH